MNYLSVEIYKSSYNCTLNFSNNFQKFVIECPSGNITKEHIEGYGIIKIVKGNIDNTAKAVFVDIDGNEIHKSGCNRMAGGHFVYCSDSRFNELTAQIIGIKTYAPVSLHDRFEG